MLLPGENLSLIIRFALQELDEDGVYEGKRPYHSIGLSLLSGFSLACQKFRQIALREVFRTYHCTKSSHLHELLRFPDLYFWIR